MGASQAVPNVTGTAGPMVSGVPSAGAETATSTFEDPPGGGGGKEVSRSAASAPYGEARPLGNPFQGALLLGPYGGEVPTRLL